MSAPGSVSVTSRRLSALAVRQLRALARVAAGAADFAAAADRLARGTADILGTEVSVERRVAPPVPEAQLPLADTARPPLRVVLDHAAREWTELALGTHAGAAVTLRLAGRWDDRRSRACLTDYAGLADIALRGPALRVAAAQAEGVVAATYAFARRLTKVHSAQPLRQFIVDTMAETTHARIGSLATYADDEGHLRVAATHGYPQVLVDHVRLVPGEGVLGRVFESRRPMLVDNLDALAGLHRRRPRYRTPSFLAVPLLSNGDVLGVVAMADRADGRPFDRSDLTAARALAAPASLALLNDRLTNQTRELAHAATVDPLTGLFNRRYFHTRIEEEIERARRYNLELAVLLIDIDNFKSINDELGHLAGDYLLRQVSDVLKRSVRVFDVCTRFGGEEFAILMPGSGAANGLAVAERVRSRVETASRESATLPHHLHITVSLGLAVLGSDPSSQELIARADRALYRAKAEGKNCVRVEE